MILNGERELIRDSPSINRNSNPLLSSRARPHPPERRVRGKQHGRGSGARPVGWHSYQSRIRDRYRTPLAASSGLSVRLVSPVGSGQLATDHRAGRVRDSAAASLRSSTLLLRVPSRTFFRLTFTRRGGREQRVPPLGGAGGGGGGRPIVVVIHATLRRRTAAMGPVDGII